MNASTIDLLVTTIIEGIIILNKMAKREITDEDLNLETFQQTIDKVKKNLGLA